MAKKVLEVKWVFGVFTAIFVFFCIVAVKGFADSPTSFAGNTYVMAALDPSEEGQQDGSNLAFVAQTEGSGLVQQTTESTLSTSVSDPVLTPQGYPEPAGNIDVASVINELLSIAVGETRSYDLGTGYMPMEAVLYGIANSVMIEMGLEDVTAVIIDPITGEEKTVIGGTLGEKIKEILNFDPENFLETSLYITHNEATSEESTFELLIGCKKLTLKLETAYAHPGKGLEWGVSELSSEEDGQSPCFEDMGIKKNRELTLFIEQIKDEEASKVSGKDVFTEGVVAFYETISYDLMYGTQLEDLWFKFYKNSEPVDSGGSGLVCPVSY